MLRSVFCKRLESICRGASIRNKRFYSIVHPQPSSTPSGWSPPTGVSAPPGATPTLPFRVIRSRFRNLPVYTDYKNGRSQILTSVRKVEGNLEVMERMLRRHLKVRNLRSRVDELTGSVTFHGNHRYKIVQWLKQMGF